MALATACAPAARPDAAPAPKEEAAAAPAMPSPLAATDGKEIFIGNCAKCHGLTGLGDGPSAGSLRTQSGLNLTILKDKSDTEIFNTISAGRGTDMAPFELVLSPEQRQEVVRYLRTLAKN